MFSSRRLKATVLLVAVIASVSQYNLDCLWCQFKKGAAQLREQPPFLVDTEGMKEIKSCLVHVV